MVLVIGGVHGLELGGKLDVVVTITAKGRPAASRCRRLRSLGDSRRQLAGQGLHCRRLSEARRATFAAATSIDDL
jgi:hypothetical protein